MKERKEKARKRKNEKGKEGKEKTRKTRKYKTRSSRGSKEKRKRDTKLHYFFFLTLLLSSFWTSRGHRCRPFSPPVFAFDFYRAKGSAIPLLVDFSLIN